MIPANVEFFFRLAASKTITRLQSAGFTRDQIAEFLARPGNLASLIESAKELHFQVIEFIESDPDRFAKQVKEAM